MKINSIFLGEQEIDPQSVISFPQGLAGFEGLQQFKLFNEEEKPTVYWLQSLDDPEVMFSASSPDIFGFAYEVVISDEDAGMLELDNPQDVAVLLLLSKPGDNSSDSAELQVRANLYGPVLINMQTRKAMQKVLHNTEQLTLIRALSE